MKRLLERLRISECFHFCRQWLARRSKQPGQEKESALTTPAAQTQEADEEAKQTVYVPAMALLDTWANLDWDNGVQIDKMDDLESLLVRTANSIYEITILSSHKSEILIRGGRFFPEFTRAHLAGASMGGSFLKLHGIYPGFRMEINANHQVIITSRVETIAVLRGPENRV